MPEGPEGPDTRVVLDDFWNALLERRRDLPALLRTIVDRVVAVVGDGCVLTTVTEDGRSLHPEAIAHADRAVADAMREVLGHGDVRIGEGIAGTVAADRHPVLLNDVPSEVVDETTPIRFLPFVRDHPMRALMIAPLVTGGELLGTLGAVRTASSEPYTPDDLRLLEALADRAALALADAIASPSTVEASDYESVFRLHPDGILITAPDGHILAANPAACSILRRSEREIVRDGRSAIVVASDPNLEPGLAERARSGHATGELRFRRGDGSLLVAHVCSTIFTTPDGRMRATVTFRDVSDEVERRRITMQRLALLEERADRDPLTGLLNRRAFAMAAERVLAEADDHTSTCHVVFLDVDALKAVNDTAGHAAGDAVLEAVASAIRRAAGDDDLAARLGGDEFVVLTRATTAAVGGLVDAIGTALAAALAGRAPVSLSIGVVERPARDPRRLDDLIDAADREMYRQRTIRRLRRLPPER